jgi:hypothetical protein
MPLQHGQPWKFGRRENICSVSLELNQEGPVTQTVTILTELSQLRSWTSKHTVNLSLCTSYMDSGGTIPHICTLDTSQTAVGSCVNSSSSHAGHFLPVPGIEPGFLGSPVHSPAMNRLSHRRSMFSCLIQVILELINLLTIILSTSPRQAATQMSDTHC